MRRTNRGVKMNMHRSGKRDAIGSIKAGFVEADDNATNTEGARLKGYKKKKDPKID